MQVTITIFATGLMIASSASAQLASLSDDITIITLQDAVSNPEPNKELITSLAAKLLADNPNNLTDIQALANCEYPNTSVKISGCVLSEVQEAINEAISATGAIGATGAIAGGTNNVPNLGGGGFTLSSGN